MDIDAGPFLLTASVPPVRVGLRLAELRGRAGLSRRDLARRLGVNRWWVRRWERGTHRVPDPVVRRVLAELDISLEELVPQRLPVRFDAARGLMHLGPASVPLDPAAQGNRAVLAAYVQLVAGTREAGPEGPWELRVDDLAVLAELLDLEAADLERNLMDVFGLTTIQAAALRARMRRQRVLVAAVVAVGMFGVTPGADATGPASPPAFDNVVHVTERRPQWPTTTAVADPGAVDGPIASVTSIVAPTGPTVPVPTTVPMPTTVVHRSPMVPESTTAADEPAAEPVEPVEPVEPEIGDAVTLERGDTELADPAPS